MFIRVASQFKETFLLLLLLWLLLQSTSITSEFVLHTLKGALIELPQFDFPALHF